MADNERTQDPQERLDWRFDWSRSLIEGEIITDAVVTVNNITIDEFVTGDDYVTAWLKGGAEGDKASVVCSIVTSNGREYRRTMDLRIRSLRV